MARGTGFSAIFRPLICYPGVSPQCHPCPIDMYMAVAPPGSPGIVYFFYIYYLNLPQRNGTGCHSHLHTKGLRMAPVAKRATPPVPRAMLNTPISHGAIACFARNKPYPILHPRTSLQRYTPPQLTAGFAR